MKTDLECTKVHICSIGVVGSREVDLHFTSGSRERHTPICTQLVRYAILLKVIDHHALKTPINRIIGSSDEQRVLVTTWEGVCDIVSLPCCDLEQPGRSEASKEAL